MSIVFPATRSAVKVTGSNQATSNAASWYTNDLNILTVTNNTASSKIFYYAKGDIVVNTGTNTVGLFNSTTFYTTQSSIIAIDDFSFTIQPPETFLTTGSSIIALLPTGSQNIANISAVDSNFSVTSSKFKAIKVAQAYSATNQLIYSKGIKVDLRQAQSLSAIAYSRTLTRHVEPIRPITRTNLFSTSSQTVFLSYPITITGNNFDQPSNFDWYLRDGDLFPITKLNLGNAVFSFTNPVHPFQLGSFNKAKLFTPTYEKVVDVLTNTNNSITVSYLPEFRSLGPLSVFLGNTQNITNVTIGNMNTIQRLEKTGFAPLVEYNTITNSTIELSSIKIASDAVRFVPERINRALDIIKEPFVVSGRTRSLTTTTNLIYSNLIKVTGRSGISNNFTSYYVNENHLLDFFYSTSSQVTLFFNNTNNNLNYGPITTARLITSSGDFAVNVISYTTDSITINDVLGYVNRTNDKNINDLFVRLGYIVNDSISTLTNSSLIAQIEKYKTSLDGTLPRLITSLVNKSNIKISSDNNRFLPEKFQALRKVQEPFVPITSTAKLTLKEFFRAPISIPARTVTYTTSSSILYTPSLRITGAGIYQSNFVETYLYDTYFYYQLENNPNFVTLFFEPYNNNTLIGNIVSVIITTPTFTITLPVNSYDINYVIIFDSLRLFDIYEGRYPSNMTIRLGIEIFDTQVIFSNSNQVTLIDKIKYDQFKSTNDQIRTDGFKGLPLKIKGEPSQIFTAKIKQFIKDNLIEPNTTTLRPVNYSTASSTLFYDLLSVTGKSGITTNFVNVYTFEENRITKTISTSAFVTLYYTNRNNNYTYGDVNKVRLISPRFDIVIAITSLTNESVTIADVLGINSNDINNINSIDQLQIRLGKDFNETISVIGDGNRTPIVSKFKTSAITIDDNLAKTLSFKQVIRFKSDNVRFSDTVGNYRLKDNQYVTIETPKPSFTKPGIVLKDTKSFVSTPIVIPSTTSLIFGSIIDIGGISRTTSTFLNYYLNDGDTFRTISSSGITTLYFTATISLSSQTFARVLGFRNLDGVEGLFYDVTLPILNLTTQSVSVAYLTGDFKFKVQLGKIFTLSGATYQTYPSSQFNIPRLNQQTFLINNPIGIDLLKTGKLGAAIKLAATTSTLSASRYKSEIVIRGEGRPIPQRTTNISTASNIVYESYLYNIYGKNATLSTAISWYLSENNIISTIPRGTSLITLYLGSLPQYYFPNGNFVRIVAPLGTYDLVHPIVSLTNDSITILDNGGIPEVTGMYAIIGTLRTTFSYSYSDPNLISQFDKQKFKNFENGSLSTITVPKLNQIAPKLTVPSNVERVGNVRSPGPKLFDPLKIVGRSIVSISTITNIIFDPTPLPVFGLNLTTSTFVNYYLNEFDILTTIPTGSNIVTAYLGNNPPYLQVKGSVIKLINPNSGFVGQFNVISSTYDSVTFLSVGTLPSSSGLLLYSGILQTTFDRVLSDENNLGRINKIYLATNWNEIRRDSYGLVKQSLFVKGIDISIKDNSLNKKITNLKSTVEIPKVDRFSLIAKVGDTLNWQSNTFTITTSTNIEFYPSIQAPGKIQSTSTFVSYYTIESNNLITFESTSNFKTFYFNESIRLDPGFSHLKLIGFNTNASNVDIILFEYLSPITSINSTSITFVYIGPLPYGNYRISLGKTFTTYTRTFNKTSNIASIDYFNTDLLSNYPSPTISYLNKAFTKVKDFIPLPPTGNVKQYKLPVVAGDRSYNNILIYNINSQLFYREPITITGRNLSSSTFVSYYLNENNQLQTFLSTSNFLTLYFDKTLPLVVDDFTVAKLTNNPVNFEFSTTIVTLTSSSITIDKPPFFELPSGPLLLYLGQYRIVEVPVITRDSALQNTLIDRYKVTNAAISSSLYSQKEIGVVGKLRTSTIVRAEAAANKINTDKVKVITNLRAEKNADSHRTTSVTTSTSLIFDSIIYYPYATNLTTSTEITNYLFDGNIINTYDLSTSTITLYFGSLPAYYQKFNTYVRLTNDLGFDRITPLLTFTFDSITIEKLKDFPSISGLRIYFGEYRTIESYSVSNTNQVQKIDWKWRNFHTFANESRGEVNKSYLSLRETADRNKTSFLQKPILKLQSSIEVPKTDKTNSILILKDIGLYRSRQLSSSTSTSILFYGPFDATGKIASTSNFITQYLFDYDQINSYYYSGITATLFVSNYLIPLNQNFVSARVVGYPIIGSTPNLDYIFTITNITTNSFSFVFHGGLPDYRYQVYFGKPFTSATSTLSDAGNVEQINVAKFKQGVSTIEIPRSYQLDKPIVKLKDLQNNINFGQTKVISRLYGDRSYTSTISIVTGTSILQYPETVVISGSSKSTSTFVKYYLDEDLKLQSYVDTSSYITLYFNTNISSTATYTLARFNGINYEFSTSFISLTNNSITILNPINTYPLPEVNSSLTVSLGRFLQAQTSTFISRDGALQLPNIVNYKIPSIAGSSQFVGLSAPSLVGKLKASNIVIGDPNRFVKTDIKVVNKLVAERNAAPVRSTILTTATSFVFDPISYKVFGIDQISSNAASYYLFEQNILTTATNTGSVLTLLLGSLPIYLRVNSTHVKIINDTGYNEIFSILSILPDRITINKPKDFPEISSVLLYFGTTRTIENVSYSDTSYLSKFNFKLGNFQSFVIPNTSQINKPIVGLKGDLFRTIPTFLQKGFIPLRSVIETPKADKVITITSLKETSSYSSRVRTISTSSVIIYDGPYDAYGTNASTSSFVSYYVNESNLISVYQYSGTTATLFVNSAISNPSIYSNVRIQAYQGPNESPFFDAAYQITSITTNTVSFQFISLPQSRFKIFLGRVITSSTSLLSGGNNVSLLERTKIPSASSIEVPRVSQLQKPVTVLKDLQNNLQIGRAASSAKLASDRSYAQSSIVINYNTTTVYGQAYQISGIDRAQSNFANQYLFDELTLQIFGSPTTGKTLFFARPLENIGNPTTVKIVRYAASFYIGNIFYPSLFYYEQEFVILGITNDYVFVDDPDNAIPVGALAVYLGYAYQQPSIIQNTNTSSLSISLVNQFKVQPSQLVYSLATYTNKLSLNQKTIGVELPIPAGRVKSINRYVGDTNRFPVAKVLSTGSYVLKQPIAFNSATIRIDNTYSQILVSTNLPPTTPREMLYYVGVAPAKYGRSITVYPRDLVSPVNNIPAKTRTVSTGSGLVWAQQSFFVYGTNLTTQTNVTWYTADNNFYTFNTNTSSNLVLYFGSLPSFYSALYFNNSHIRLVNSQGYDEVFSIVTSTVDTVTIPKPVSLPSVQSLRAFFGSTSTIETLTWNDQGIVPTFTTALNTTYNVQRLIFLVSPGIIVPPNKFTIAEKIKESNNLLTSPIAKIDQAFTASVTSYIPVNLRPTSAREIMAVLFVAPGLRLNRSISQGMLFSDFGDNFKPSSVKAPLSVKAPTRVENVFKLDSINTQTSFASGNTSSRALIYYTNLAPGYRKGIYYNTGNREFFVTNRDATAQEFVPKIPYTFRQVPIAVKSVQSEPLGLIQKPFTQLKLVPSVIDPKTQLNKSILAVRPATTNSEITLSGKAIVIPSMRGDTIPFRFSLINNLDINVISIQDESFFDVNKYFAITKVAGDANVFQGNQQFKFLNFLKQVGPDLKIDNINKFTVKSNTLQFFDTPRFSLFDKNLKLKLTPIEINLTNGEVNAFVKVGQTDQTNLSFIRNNQFKTQATSLVFQPLGDINKPTIVVKNIPVILEKVNSLEKRSIIIRAPLTTSESGIFAGIRIIPAMKADIIPIRPYFLEKAKALAFTIDDKLSKIDKLSVVSKLHAEPNRFPAIENIQIKNNFKSVDANLNTNLINKFLAPARTTQVFYSPDLSYLNDQSFKIVLDYDEPDLIFGQARFAEKFVTGAKHYNPVNAINFARHYNFQTFVIDKTGIVKAANVVRDIIVDIGSSALNKPVTKLAFDEDRLLVYKEKLGNLQKGQYAAFYVAENIGYIRDKARFDELRSLIFIPTTGKIQPYAAIRAAVDLEEKPLGIFQRIDKVGIVVINFDDTGNVEFSPEGISEAVDSQLYAENGYLIRFKNAQSAALQDPATRRVEPIQFWN